METLQALREPSTPHVMGILNITEDSFSDGGLWLDASAAAQHGRDLVAQGATILDIGAESTRPGAVRVDADTERSRIVTAVRNLRGLGVPLSIDTTRASVARAALDEGASIINDVSGGRLDSEIPRLVAQRDCLYIVQHWRQWLSGGSGGVADSNSSTYVHGVVADVYDELMAQVDDVLAAGVAPEKIIIDPGLGFSKPGVDLNLPLMTHLATFRASGYPVLIGASRKRFVGALLKNPSQGEHADEPTTSRKDVATAVLSALCALSGAWAVRVHDAAMSRDALAVAQAWKSAEPTQRDAD
ncbi:MAG: dihydropteroate synthase [Bifidobacteriaceae bacterium]|nr:dihydropteroate synthase [Bifidobacteriaceae bacterium]